MSICWDFKIFFECHFILFHYFNHFSGNWEIGPQRMLGLDIKNSTVGIVGLGGIGQMIVNRLKGFELKKILYCGHKEKPEGMFFS